VKPRTLFMVFSGSSGGERGRLSLLNGCKGLAHGELQDGGGRGFEGEKCLFSCKFWFLFPRPPATRHFLLVVCDEYEPEWENLLPQFLHSNGFSPV